MRRQKTLIACLMRLIPLMALGACSTTEPTVSQRLDEGTGVTISYARTPFLLVHDMPAYGAYARSFVQLGAIEVNRMGSREYFLWMSTWNTDHVAGAAEHRDGFDSAVLFVDGEPIALDVHGWTHDMIGASQPIYVRPFASSTDAYYRVTINQMALIALADDLWLRTGGKQPRDFQLWDEQAAARADFVEFVQRLGGD